MTPPIPSKEVSYTPNRPPYGRAWLAASILAVAAVAPTASTARTTAAARTASFVARDAARHPAEELTFFGLRPSMTVVELWPGGGYWTEILGPYLKPSGHYSIATQAPGDAEQTLAACYRALKPGGIFGIEEHRGRTDKPQDPKAKDGWVDGVWTLPPTLSQGDQDRDRYLAIGEADNFVLKFQKPNR
jgi:predicted methyltransferase